MPSEVKTESAKNPRPIAHRSTHHTAHWTSSVYSVGRLSHGHEAPDRLICSNFSALTFSSAWQIRPHARGHWKTNFSMTCSYSRSAAGVATPTQTQAVFQMAPSRYGGCFNAHTLCCKAASWCCRLVGNSHLGVRRALCGSGPDREQKQQKMSSPQTTSPQSNASPGASQKIPQEWPAAS